jgi:hypothetical protein
VVILNRCPRTPAPWARVAATLALALLLWTLAAPGNTQTASDEAEYQVKAAFLYKFLGFVEWPNAIFSRADAPIVIGVLGAEPLAEELSRIVVSRTVSGRSVAVRRFGGGDPVVDVHVLFVSRANSARLPAILAATRGRALLTVSESDDARASEGSVINFVTVDDKVRFDVRLDRAEQAGLRISARLLSVARKVVAS